MKGNKAIATRNDSRRSIARIRTNQRRVCVFAVKNAQDIFVFLCAEGAEVECNTGGSRHGQNQGRIFIVAVIPFDYGIGIAICNASLANPVMGIGLQVYSLRPTIRCP